MAAHRPTDQTSQPLTGETETGYPVAALLRDGRPVTVPPPDEEAGARARARLDELAKPPGSLAELENLGARLAAMTGRVPPALGRKAVVVMAADHGVVEEGVSAYPQKVTALMVRTLLEGRAAINVLARQAGAEVVCVDVGVRGPIPGVDVVPAAGGAGGGGGDGPGRRDPLPPGIRFVRARVRPGTANFTRGPAMTRQEARQALAAGACLAAELAGEGFGLLATGEIGIGNTTSSAAIVSAFTGLPPERVVGPGTGLDEPGLARKRAAVRQALAVNGPDPSDALEVLAKVGGLEIAALAGLMVGAAALRLPVVLDGVVAGAAALVAEALVPGTRYYLIAGHLSAEPAHRVALERVGLRPCLDLGLRLGEGTGAVLAFHLVEAAVRVMTEMASLRSVLAAGGELNR